MDFSSAFITFMFVFQESVILSNPGECESAVPRALTEPLSIEAVHPVNLTHLPGKRVAEAVQDHAELSLCDRGPPRFHHRTLHHVSPRIPAVTERCC
jgi:hypothetical protein